MTEPKVIWFPAFEEALPSLEGKTVAITGCTQGIGLIVAKSCVKKGAENVLLLNRSSERATKAEEEIKAFNANNEGGKKTNVETIPCDLQDFASVREAIASICAKYDALDVLCNNAGIALVPDKATKDGYCVQMQTNHLSHFLLVKDLFPLLQKATELRGEARIVHHTSGARRNAGTKPDSPGLEAPFLEKNGGNLGGDSPGWSGAMAKRYQQSKLANSAFSVALAKKLEGTNVKAVLAAPGITSTGMWGHALSKTQQASFGDRIMNAIMARLVQSGPDGAMPILRACFDPATENGDFFEPEKWSNAYGPAIKVEYDEKTANPENATLLWGKSEEAVGKFDI
ncbi:Uncharacterized oxidoreductase C736.13 [Seminavis robusta]|uniref:Uncharacterized oxidoreductase C736.13 n=1 Tax=Seminavis robusta TaxID=568900 RepID=A0A9N8HUU6_9STRA|nr:Uncharacterized oxidoreductase C736.13 [Seminavis robusta]|eukprot:Sro2169_g317360.1 Uncharacterized oxidoreductase C736.13 (342) ;mRNA; f:8390-9415